MDFSFNFKNLIFRDKGVKVELGIPYELWDKPSVEITHLKTQCESLLEDHEDDIKNWYEEETEEHKIELIDHLCGQRALKNEDSSCLREKGDTGKLLGEEKKKPIEKESKKKSKKDSKSKKPKNDKTDKEIKVEL